MKNAVDGTTWNDSLASALRAFKLGDLDLAEQRLDRAFAGAEDDEPYLHLLAGHIALSRGTLVEAEKAWIRAKDLNPEDAEAWNNLGVLYRRKGEDDKALAAFQEAADKAPDRPDIPYNIGNLHKAAGHFDEAVSAYNRSIEIEPSYAPAYNNLGTLYETRKERDKALEIFKRGLTADKGDPSLRFNMGLVFQEQERWDDAHEAFDRALKSRPGWVPGLNNLGIVLQEMGREDEAARTFRSLLDIEPENISALNNLGVAYDRLGRTDDARNCFRKALEEEPDYLKAALNLHDSFHDGQELNEALEEINKQITHHPRDPEIRVRMGRTLMGLTRWDEAERSLDHVLERNPEHRDTLRAKAELFLATRRPKEAEAILKQLPHDPDAVRDLARLYIATERPGDAERLLGELTAVSPDDAESRRLLSELLAETRPDEAAKLREEAAEAEPGDTGDLVSLAELYGRSGSSDAALSKLDEAVNILGSRGEAEDLDALNEVLSLYEKAAEALADEKGDLFAERSTQLGRKLQSAMGGRVAAGRKPRRSIAQEIPLEQEDALSLLDLNAMEPVIRINEEEETVYLDESTEDLDEAWTELSNRERLRDEAARTQVPAEAPSGGPPVHIHMPAQPAGPMPPQVIYQDIRTVPQPPSDQEDEALPEMIVEEIIEEEIPLLEEEPGEEETGEEEQKDRFSADDMEISEEELITDEEELTDDDLELGEEELLSDDFDDEDDEPFFIPESDALSEDLPETEETEIPEVDLVFSNDAEEAPLEEPEEAEEPEELILEEGLELLEDFEAVLEEELPENNKIEETQDEVAAESPAGDESADESTNERPTANEPAPPEPEEDAIDADKVADMFKYLSDLTDTATGEGREQLIEDGIPLKIAGVYARLTGEPNFREAAQKYDRRNRERHNIELNEDKIRESLTAFRNLAESFPVESVRESLSKKLSQIMDGVGKLADGENPDVKAPEDEDGNVPQELLAGLTGETGESDDDDLQAAHDDFAAVLPDLD